MGNRQVLLYQKIPRASNYVLDIVIIILNKSNAVVSTGMKSSGFILGSISEYLYDLRNLLFLTSVSLIVKEGGWERWPILKFM